MVSRTLCICAIGLVAFVLTNLPGDSISQQVDTKLVAHLADDKGGDGKVALIDINKVFEQHARFQQRFKELGERFKKLEASVKKEQEELTRITAKLATMRPGTPEYQEEQNKFAKKESDLKQAAELEQKALAADEAKIYMETYQEIEAKCEEIGKRKGITLFLRHHGGEMKAGDQNSVRTGLSRMVVFQRGHDVTDEVIEEFRDKAPLEPKASISKSDEALFALHERVNDLESK